MQLRIANRKEVETAMPERKRKLSRTPRIMPQQQRRDYYVCHYAKSLARAMANQLLDDDVSESERRDLEDRIVAEAIRLGDKTVARLQQSA